jgi:hypothetical protein
MSTQRYKNDNRPLSVEQFGNSLKVLALEDSKVGSLMKLSIFMQGGSLLEENN